MNYMKRILVSVDQLLNVLAGGDEDETLSSRIYTNSIEKAGVWLLACKLVDACFFWQTNHCKQAFLFEFSKKIKYLKANEKYRVSL